MASSSVVLPSSPTSSRSSTVVSKAFSFVFSFVVLYKTHKSKGLVVQVGDLLGEDD